MPFDIAPEYTEAKPDVFSLDGLTAWLEKQPCETVYCYYDHGCCLAAQFNAACGRKYNPPGIPGGFLCDKQDGWRFVYDGPAPDLRAEPFDRLLELIAVNGDRTFGAALQRAYALRRVMEG